MASSKTSSGISTTMVIFLIFLTLKLTGLINWSWWWITSPLWIPVIIAIAIIAIIAITVITALSIGFSQEDVKKIIKK